MEIIINEEGKPTVFTIAGRIDTNTSPQLEQFVEKLYSNDVNDIVVNMAQCDFVSSAGLRVIVMMQKRASQGGTLVFKDVQQDVLDVFEMTGFNKILTIE